MGSAIEYDTSALAYKDEGYHKGLKPRQLQMIAIGGAIGTGLFMGPAAAYRGSRLLHRLRRVRFVHFLHRAARWVSLCCIALRPDRSSPVRANSSVKRPLRGRVVQRAINSVVFRIAVFYVGSLVLLTLLLPYTAYKQGTSPFVTFFSSIGVPAAGDIVNFVVLTAALSSLNAGLYSTGRILRSMAMNGSAPAFTAKMTKHGVPFAGIALTGCFTVAGVFLNLVVPSEAFNIAAAAVVPALRWASSRRNLVALVVIIPALVGAAGTPYGGGCWRWPPSASASPATTRHRRDARDGRIPRQGRQGVSARSR